MATELRAGPIVLLHGFTNTGASWAPVAAALPPDTEVIAPDLRGHGTARARRPVNLAAVLDDLLALAPDRFLLAGYSMGGRIALHLALAQPGRVEGLILIGASPGLREPDQRAARLAADERLAGELETITIEQFAERWAATPVLSGQSPQVLAAARRDRLRSTPAGLAAALRGLGTGALPQLWDRLGELPMPVTLVAGERDAKFRAIAEEMAELLPDARIEVVQGAGHAVHLESPDAVAAIIATRRSRG